MGMKKVQVLVIGSGWSAMASAALALSKGLSLVWVKGSGCRMWNALPTLPMGSGVGIFSQVLSAIGIEAGEFEQGLFLRDFRNKSFRSAAWQSSSEGDDIQDCIESWEALSLAERSFTGLKDGRYFKSVCELEAELANYLESQDSFEKIEGAPLKSVKGHSVELLNGQTIEAEHIIYADAWHLLRSVEGIPEELSWAKSSQTKGKSKTQLEVKSVGRNWKPGAVLQVSMQHSFPVGSEVREAFVSSLQKEAGEEDERRFWGGFSSSGETSRWSLFLNHDEVDDNHQIGKKLRRIRQALNKMFHAEQWIASGKQVFTDSVIEETVRLEEGVVFHDGEIPQAPVRFESMIFLTDGFGLEKAMALLGKSLVELFDLRLQDVDESLESASDRSARTAEGTEFQTSSQDIDAHAQSTPSP